MDIIALLIAKGFDVVHKGGAEYSIVCPNQQQHAGGADNKPSFNLNIDKKMGHCFACDFKMNEIGLARWLIGDDLDEDQMRAIKLKSSLKRLKEDAELTLVDSEVEVMFPVGEPWDIDGYRGISLETYRKVGAIKVDRGRYANRLVVEVRMHGDLVGLDARSLGSEVPKYLRPKGCNAKSWLFPYDLCHEIIKDQGLDYALLGEGLFHSLNSCNHQIPACCYFGSNNFSQENVLQLLDLGISEIIIFPDMDKAGLAAVTYIADMLKQFFTVSVASTEMLTPLREVNGKTVYKDLGDLTKREILESILRRSRYKWS